MRKIRPDMEFLAVTDDVEAAYKILPEVKAVRNDIGKDYVTIKNARYLLLSNSSFAVFPAFTSMGTTFPPSSITKSNSPCFYAVKVIQLKSMGTVLQSVLCYYSCKNALNIIVNPIDKMQDFSL